MAKRKLERFAEVGTFNNVFHVPFDPAFGGIDKKGKWCIDYFKNNNPIVLELGCGKGEYTVGLAQKYPNKNFIGVDIKGNRIWRGAKTALEKKMTNVAFVRTRIDFIERCFAEVEVNEIWITFPDPHPAKGKSKKRLTSPSFLKRYKNILTVGGLVHLKTDSSLLYEYTLEVLKENNYKTGDSTSDLYATTRAELDEAKAIQTYYEKKFLQQEIPICYLRFSI
jgi:tRNA (guanine-N7-)-methyltransferase